jgi:CopG-like RHH_1 or ribbon-helix-helix domain, RHH_5
MCVNQDVDSILLSG